MAKVHSVIARVDYPEIGVRRGDRYYWWQFRGGPPIKSKEPPKPQQTTRNEFLIAIFDARDLLKVAETGPDVEGVAEAARAAAEIAREKRDAMPEALQDSTSGQELEERGDAADDWASRLDAAASDYPNADEFEDDASFEEARSGWIEETREIDYEGP